VLANDSDTDGNLDPASVTVTSGPANGGTGVNTTTGMITYTPDPDFNGSDSFVYEVCDDGTPLPAECATATVSITINAVNDAPSFTAGPDQTVDEDAGAQTINGWATGISAGPPDEAGQVRSFNITGNTDPSLFSAGPAVDPTTGDLTFTPAADTSGSATITLTLSDDGGSANGGVDTSTPASFTITVNPVNDAPTFTAGADVTVLEDSGAYDQPWATGISAGPADESGQILTFDITANDNPGLFAAGPAIDAGSGNLGFTPAADAFGVANLTVELMDDGGTANGGVDTSASVNLVITVTNINDAPTFTAGPDPTVDEDSGAQMVNGWATGIDAGAPNEAGQVLTFNITGNTNPGLFSSGPSVNPSTGDLTFTPAANAFGTATIMLELTDDGGTADGGVDTSPAQSFTITVNPVNDPPQLTPPGPFDVTGNVRIQVTDGPDDLLVGASDPADGAGATPFMATATTTSSTMGGDVTIAAGGTFSYDPPAGFIGMDSFTYEVCDSGVPGTACATADVMLNVSGLVWFIDPAGTAGDGRLSTPFNDIDAFDAVNNGTGTNPAANQDIFLFNGTHDGSVTLLPGQRAFGQSATATLTALTGITLPTYSDSFPMTNVGTTTVQANNADAITLGMNNTLRGFDVGNTGTGSDIAGNGFGTLTVSEVNLSGSGRALNLAGGTLADGAGAPGFGSISSTSGANNITLVNVSGTPTLGSGVLSGASGVAFLVSGGSGTFTYGGSISNTTNRVVDVQNKTAGAVNLSGDITGTAQGVVLAGNAGASVSFSGTLTLTTGSNNAVSASGGGTVTATGPGSVVTTTTGTAVRIDGVNIGAGGFTVQSVTSVGGANPGIILANTGSTGNFVIAGNGGSCTSAATCTGGSIRGKTGNVDGVSLTNTANPRFNFVHIANNSRNGIFGSGVNGFELIESLVESNADQASPDEAGILMTNLTGTLSGGSNPARIVRSTIRDSHEHNIKIENNSGTLADLVVEESFIRDTPAGTGASGLLLQAIGTASMGTTVTNTSFIANKSSGIRADAGDTMGSFVRVDVDNSTFTGAGNSNSSDPAAQNVGVNVSIANAGSASFMVTNSIFTGHRAIGINFFSNASTSAATTVTGSILGNTIGTQSVPNSGSVFGNGIDISNEGANRIDILIDGNTVQGVGDGVGNGFEGIFINDVVNAGAINATVTNNVIRDIFDDRGLVIQERVGGTHCSDIAGNSFSNIEGAFCAKFAQVAKICRSTVRESESVFRLEHKEQPCQNHF